MSSRLIDTVTVITALVLLPMVAVSAHAYLSGALTFPEYSALWAEPLALLLGFWLRGMGRES